MEEDEELTDDEVKEEAAKNKAKNMLGKGTSKVKKLVTKAIVFLLKKYGKWVLIILLVLILFVILFNQYEKVIFNDVLSSVKKATGAEEINFTTNANIVKKDGTYCLQIDASVMEQIEKNLEEAKIKPKDLNLDDFNCFREFIKAEIATQYPQLGTIDKEKYKDNKAIITDGVIKIKRATSGKDAKQLYYIPEEDFQKKCDANDSEALNYFTLNKDREIVIASYSKTVTRVTTSGDTSITEVPSEEEIYTITTQTIDYLSIVQKYTMPFSLLLAILQTSDSEEMALEFAKLAQESEMEITIQDNKEINTYVETREVHQEISGEKSITYQVIVKDASEVQSMGEGPINAGVTIDNQEKNAKIEINTVVETNTPNLELTKVDCWLAKFENTYKYKDNSKNPDTSSSKSDPIKNEEAIQCDINTDTDVANFISAKETYWATYKPEGGSVIVNKWDFRADVKKITTTTTTTNTSTVNQKYSTTKSKVEKNDEKIFKIFRGEVAGEDEELEKKLKEGYGSLYDAQEWFYGLLESDSQTKEFVDIMKYFIKKFHNDPDAKEYDTDLYSAEDFESAGGNGGISYESLKLTNKDLEILYKITSAERGGGTQEQQEYVVSVILNRVLASGWPNTVEGVVFQEYQFQPTRNGAYEAAKPSATTKKAVNNVVKNGDTTASAPGNTNGLPAVYFMTPAAAEGQASWLKNCTYLFNDEDGASNGSHNFYTTTKVAAELEKYKSSSGGEFLEVAKKCWEKVCKSGKFTSYGGSSIPCTGPSIDCSAYVSWVLYEYGYKDFKGWQTTTGPFLSTDWNKKYGWTEIKLNAGENPISKLQPGDLLVRHTPPNNGHITLVVSIENGRIKTYDCGGSNHWIGNTSAKTCDATYMLTDSRPGKVIRVTAPK